MGNKAAFLLSVVCACGAPLTAGGDPGKGAIPLQNRFAVLADPQPVGAGAHRQARQVDRQLSQDPWASPVKGLLQAIEQQKGRTRKALKAQGLLVGEKALLAENFEALCDLQRPVAASWAWFRQHPDTSREDKAEQLQGLIRTLGGWQVTAEVDEAPVSAGVGRGPLPAAGKPSLAGMVQTGAVAALLFAAGTTQAEATSPFNAGRGLKDLSSPLHKLDSFTLAKRPEECHFALRSDLAETAGEPQACRAPEAPSGCELVLRSETSAPTGHCHYFIRCAGWLFKGEGVRSYVPEVVRALEPTRQPGADGREVFVEDWQVPVTRMYEDVYLPPQESECLARAYQELQATVKEHLEAKVRQAAERERRSEL